MKEWLSLLPFHLRAQSGLLKLEKWMNGVSHLTIVSLMPWSNPWRPLYPTIKITDSIQSETDKCFDIINLTNMFCLFSVPFNISGPLSGTVCFHLQRYTIYLYLATYILGTPKGLPSHAIFISKILTVSPSSPGTQVWDYIDYIASLRTFFWHTHSGHTNTHKRAHKKGMAHCPTRNERPDTSVKFLEIIW